MTHTKEPGHSLSDLTLRRGVKKHKEAIFIKAGEVFVAKVYGHEGQPVEANAKHFVDSVEACSSLSDPSVVPEILELLTILSKALDAEMPTTILWLKHPEWAAIKTQTDKLLTRATGK